MGGGAAGAAVLGVLALGAAPADAPDHRPPGARLTSVTDAVDGPGRRARSCAALRPLSPAGPGPGGWRRE